MTINGDHNSDVFLIQFFHKGLKLKFNELTVAKPKCLY